MRKLKKPEYQLNIAKERIEILFNLAEKEFHKHPARSRRYVQLARKIALRYNIRLSKEMKRKFCKNCNNLLKPKIGAAEKIDKKTKIISVTCLNCKSVYRFFITRKS